jgi:flagellar hook-basal body complex protein FliE
MDLRFPPTVSPLSPVRSSALSPKTPPAASGGVGSAGFSGELSNALKSVSAAQSQAGSLANEVQMENPAVSLEQTMVAIQKAQIGFQATLQVRNRMVQAYTDIMNMQV